MEGEATLMSKSASVAVQSRPVCTFEGTSSQTPVQYKHLGPAVHSLSDDNMITSKLNQTPKESSFRGKYKTFIDLF